MSVDMNEQVEGVLLDTDVEASLRESVRALLARTAPPEALTAMFDGDRSAAQATWSGISGDLGVAGLSVPEALGGVGASAREVGVVSEEIGRACAPGPFLTSSVVATTALLAAGDAARELVGRAAAGEAVVALALPWTASAGAWRETALPEVRQGALAGSVRSVAGAVEATHLLVPAADGLYLLDAEAAQVDAVSSLDETRPVADLSFSDAPGVRLLEGEAAQAAVDAALLTGAAALASEQVGVARWALDHTVEYLQQRRQFGRIVGGYQALKHRLAQVFIDVESADAAARFAAVQLARGGAGDPEAQIAVRTAAAFCSDVAVRAAEEALQLHGGVGMTWEYPVHLYLKRAKTDELALGTSDAHRVALAALVGIPAPITAEPQHSDQKAVSR